MKKSSIDGCLSIKIQRLRCRPDLLEETALFVNKEWARSLNAR